MGKFKTPFSSQNTQESGPKRKYVLAAKKHHNPPSKDREQLNASPLHLGRVDVVTPRLKNKIKQRFAAGLAQLQSGIKQTSPGVPVPFDLSQSQPTTSQQTEPSVQESQQSKTSLEESQQSDPLLQESQQSETSLEESQKSEPLLEESQQSDPLLEESQQSEPLLDVSHQFGEFIVNDKANTQEVNGESVEPAADDKASQVNNMPTREEFCLVFDEEFEDENKTTQTAENPLSVKHYDETRTFELADKDQDDGNDVAKSTRVSDIASETPRVKKKTIKKKQIKALTKSQLKAVQDGASEYDFDGSEKIAESSTLSTAARGHINKRNYQLLVKQNVLQTIYKMHREITVLQKRRTELTQGNIKGGNFLQGKNVKMRLPLQTILPRPLLEE